ncbi:hypothetical protein BDN70DRAFT_734855 [Pholiota conissans]|uniref:Uncharacterized protein n=1 Tax=Pholiota conissans TaxID=109636 RepID=A0A9P5YJU4_9AGAR|nr:hypothetical protein BDN70DRAFT_734855 [Pholiota conissans]
MHTLCESSHLRRRAAEFVISSHRLHTFRATPTSVTLCGHKYPPRHRIRRRCRARVPPSSYPSISGMISNSRGRWRYSAHRSLSSFITLSPCAANRTTTATAWIRHRAGHKQSREILTRDSYDPSNVHPTANQRRTTSMFKPMHGEGSWTIDGNELGVGVIVDTITWTSSNYNSYAQFNDAREKVLTISP